MRYVTVAILLQLLVYTQVHATQSEVLLEIPWPEAAVDADGFTHLSISGFLTRGRPGQPSLPERTVNLLIPPGHRVEAVEVTPTGWVDLPGRHFVFPAQAPRPICSKRSRRFTGPGPVYGRKTVFPGSPGRAMPLQRLRGFVIQPVIVRPVTYHPRSGQLAYAPVVRITVTSAPDQKTGDGYRGLARDFDRVCSLVANPGQLQEYPGTQAIARNDTRYVIITSQELSDCPGPDNFQALAASKEARGITTLIKTTQSIYSEYNGSDEAEKIRNFITDVYQNGGAEYVLLAGDADLSLQGGETEAPIVPVRQLYAYSEYDGQDSIASDLYYACLDGTFNADGDGTYGEPQDNVDLLAEVYVGRAPVDGCGEVSRFVKKTLAYPLSGGDWLRSVWMMGEKLTDVDWGKDDLVQLENGSSQDGFTSRGFNQSTFFEVDTPYDRDQGEWSPGDALQVLNGGVHIVNHLGHSYTNYNMRLELTDIDGGLQNAQPFFLYTQGCYPGAFDNRAENDYVFDTDSFTEHLLLQGKGAFAVVSNTRYGWVGVSNHFHRTFWDALFFTGEQRLGPMNAYSREFFQGWADDDYIRWIYYEITLFGDPEISLKTDDTPVEPALALGGVEAFRAALGGSRPADQSLSIANAGGGVLNWTATSDAAWLTVQPGSGMAPGQAMLSADPAGLGPGSHQATLMVSSPEAVNSPVGLTIELHVIEVPAVEAPFSASVPVIDGQMMPGEYDDSNQLNLDPAGTFRAWIQNDGHYLYLAVDATTDASGDFYDLFSLFFDLNNDGRWPPNLGDEGLYDIYADGSTYYYPVHNPGSGFQLGDVQDLPPGVTAAFNAGMGHQVVEARVDLNASRLSLPAGATFGLYLTYMDYLSDSEYRVLGKWPPGGGPEHDLSGGPDDCLFFGKVTIGEETPAEDLLVSPNFLDFQAVMNGPPTAPMDLFVTASENGLLEFGLSASQPWIRLSNATGATPGSVSVWVDPAGLGPGSHSADLVIASPAAGNGTVMVPVSCSVQEPSQNQPPGAPLAVSPLEYTRVHGHNLELVVQNAVDPEGQPLRYLFEVYDERSGVLVLQQTESQQVPMTIATLAVPLDGKTSYWWRARAIDSLNAMGPWSGSGNFVVEETVIRGGCACHSGSHAGGYLSILLILLLLGLRLSGVDLKKNS